MNFLIDAQLPPSLAVRLCEAGHAAVHVTAVLPGDAADSAVLQHAATAGQIIISKDADFITLARQARQPVQLLWVRLGNCGNRQLVDRMLVMLPDLQRALATGAPVVELR